MEMNAFPSIDTTIANPKKEAIYEEMLSRAMKFIEHKVRQTKIRLLEKIITKNKIDEEYAIQNYDL